MSVISPPDRIIKLVKIKKGARPGTYKVVAYGPGRVPLFRYRGAKSVTWSSGVVTEISGFHTTILVEPSAGLNSLEILEGETAEVKYIEIRGVHKILA